MKRNLLMSIVSLGCIALIWTTSASAAEGYKELEEVVVTANRVETGRQVTPIAVSSFNTNVMEDRNISGPMDYEALVPCLSIQLSPNRTSIRGVGRFSNSLGIAPGVAMYEDGAYNQENTALGSDPMNTERVEILRGPQGTLYGRNTTGGATNIINKRPTDDFYLELRTAAGNHGNREAKALVSGPLTDTIRGKVYYSQWWSDGYYDNLSGHDTKGATHGANYYLQWMVDWQVTDNLYVMYKGGNLQYSYYEGGTSSFTPYDPFNVCTSVLGGWCAQYAQVQAGIAEPLDTFTVDRNSVGEQGLDDHLSTTIHVIYDFENVQMKYVGYHNHYDWLYFDVDNDGTAHPTIGTLNDIQQNQRITTHEVTFSSTNFEKLSWIAGAYYLDDENWQPYTLRDLGNNTAMEKVLPISFYSCFFPCFMTDADVIATNPNQIYYYQEGLFENQNWSVFGEARYQLNPSWALTLGLRYSEDDIKGTEKQLVYGDSDMYINPAWHAWCAPFGCLGRAAIDYNPTNALGQKQTERVSEDDYSDLSGRMIVEYTPNDRDLFWLTISNAFKVGGLRLGAMQGLSQGTSPFFDGETVTMYELGWKGSPTGRLQFETVGFWYDYSDMQQLRDYRNDVGITLADVINVDAEMYGVELTATWLATSNLMIFTTYSYNHAEFSEHMFIQEQDIEAHCDQINAFGDCLIDIEGNKLDITPDHKLAINALYTWYTNAGEFGLGGTWSYVGERYMDIFNSPELKGDSYNRVDLTAFWKSPQGHWKVEAYVKNATDEEWFNTKGVTANSNQGIRYGYTKYLRYSGNPANPRMYMLELQYIL
ncbi:MAG: TonB-dependent receptor [Pseudomonadales bacterium]|nr:TonB-dependent receptor [Pseudomonadales bacterium]